MTENAAATPLPAGIQAVTSLVVRGALVYVTSPARHGYRFHVSREVAARHLTGLEQALDAHPGREAEGFLCLGTLEVDQATQQFAWQVALQEPRVAAILDEAARRFLRTVEAYGRWPSFADYLATRFGHDPRFANPAFLPRVDWYWAVSAPGGPHVHPIGLYQDVGLFVPATDGLLRVSSSPMAFLQSSGHPANAGGPRLGFRPLGCLGCFMTGAAGPLGPAVVRGALLDDQWRIAFSTCDRHGGDKPTHFAIDDGGTTFHLHGCAEDGYPVWVEQGWVGTTFQVDCTPRPWVAAG